LSPGAVMNVRPSLMRSVPCQTGSPGVPRSVGFWGVCADRGSAIKAAVAADRMRYRMTSSSLLLSQEHGRERNTTLARTLSVGSWQP